MNAVSQNRRWHEQTGSEESDEQVIAKTNAAKLIEQSSNTGITPIDVSVLKRKDDDMTRRAIIEQTETMARELLNLKGNWRQTEVAGIDEEVHDIVIANTLMLMAGALQDKDGVVMTPFDFLEQGEEDVCMAIKSQIDSSGAFGLIFNPMLENENRFK